MTLRFASEKDYAAMLEIYRPYVEQTTVSFEYETPSSEEFSKRFISLEGTFPAIVSEENGQIVGYAYASPAFERKAYCWCADLSVYVRWDMRGRGTGMALTNAVLDILKRLGYRKVYSLITGENQKSRAFHEKMGFEIVAEFRDQGYKMGRWLSVFWYEKQLNGADCAQSFPKKFIKENYDLSRYE